MSKTMKILFTASVLLNVLLLGMTGGVIYKKWAHHPWHKVKAELQPETRSLIARTFQKNHRDIRSIGKEARAARDEMMDALQAEEFDTEKFSQTLEQFRQAQSDMMRVRMKSLEEVAAALPAQERRVLAQKLGNLFDRMRRIYEQPRHKSGKSRPDEPTESYGPEAPPAQ